jgi:hypothetical protein
MIRRDADSHFLLITQHDHATLSGELARHLGNATFGAPSPLHETVEGIAHHDAGWPLHDDEPTLNKDGLPLHVFEVPGPVAIRVWSASVEHAAALGPYQGLLVSLHVLGLSAYAQAHMAPGSWSRQDVFELNKFQHRQVEVQERLRAEVGLSSELPLHMGLAKLGASPADDLLLFNFRLLIAMDRVSLALCCGKNLFPKIEDVYAKPGQQPTTISLSMSGPNSLEVTPWPFSVEAEQIQLHVPAKRIGREPFTSAQAFHAAYRNAPNELLTFAIRQRQAGSCVSDPGDT